MELITADNAGACYGVSRSLDLAMKAAESGKKVATLGELIHNPLVVKSLYDDYGVSVVDSIDQAKTEGIETLIIRSHGVPIEILQEAKSSGIEVVDATCPYVKNVCSAASLLAGLYPAVIIIGKVGHPEVESVSSYIKSSGAACYVGETKEEIDSFLDEVFKLKDTVGVVSQTTQSVEVFNEMLKYLSAKGLKIEVENTICVVTKKRQQSAVDISKKVDAMIVLGGHNSSNTNHLAELCRENCKYVFHIESADELNIEEIQVFDTVGLTAGASTPKNHIDQIINHLSVKVV